MFCLQSRVTFRNVPRMDTPVSQFIDAKGVATLAHAAGVEPNTVCVWRARKRIPRRVWPELIAKLPDVTMDALLATERAA